MFQVLMIIRIIGGEGSAGLLKTLVMNVFWSEHYLLTDEQLEVESNKTFSVCKGQGARGQSVTQLYVDTENVQKL